MADALCLRCAEIAICAMAAYFLGTRTSNYSLTVREERRARGHKEDTHDFLAAEVPQAG